MICAVVVDQVTRPKHRRPVSVTADSPTGSPAWPDATASTAFLEALVNEVILDVVDPPAGGPSARVAGIPVDAKTTAAFQKLWKNERRIKGGPLGKYQAALDPSPSPG